MAAVAAVAAEAATVAAMAADRAPAPIPNPVGQHSYANTNRNQTRTRNSYAYAGSQGGSGVPKAVIRQYVLATGLSQGEVASTLKSWNSLNRNPRAFAATLNNPHALPALQVAYIRDNMLAQQQAGRLHGAGRRPDQPADRAAVPGCPGVSRCGAALADAVGTIGRARRSGTYDRPGGCSQHRARLSYTEASAQTVVAQYDAWTTYQTAEATATDAFKAASVSYRNADQTTLDALRTLVDDIIKTEGLDTMVSSL